MFPKNFGGFRLFFWFVDIYGGQSRSVEAKARRSAITTTRATINQMKNQ